MSTIIINKKYQFLYSILIQDLIFKHLTQIAETAALIDFTPFSVIKGNLSTSIFKSVTSSLWTRDKI